MKDLGILQPFENFILRHMSVANVVLSIEEQKLTQLLCFAWRINFWAILTFSCKIVRLLGIGFRRKFDRASLRTATALDKSGFQ